MQGLPGAAGIDFIETGEERRRQVEGDEVGFEVWDLGGEEVEPPGAQEGEDAAFGGDALGCVRRYKRIIVTFFFFQSKSITGIF